MANEISNYDDVIDSRDVIARIEELEEARDCFTPDETGLAEYTDEQNATIWAEQNPEDADELEILRKLAEEASEYSPDWKYGTALIRDSYFREYAEDYANDCCEMPRDAAWPFRHIDWERAAEELKQDYTSVDFDGVTYWVR